MIVHIIDIDKTSQLRELYSMLDMIDYKKRRAYLHHYVICMHANNPQAMTFVSYKLNKMHVGHIEYIAAVSKYSVLKILSKIYQKINIMQCYSFEIAKHAIHACKKLKLSCKIYYRYASCDINYFMRSSKIKQIFSHDNIDIILFRSQDEYLAVNQYIKYNYQSYILPYMPISMDDYENNRDDNSNLVSSITNCDNDESDNNVLFFIYSSIDQYDSMFNKLFLSIKYMENFCGTAQYIFNGGDFNIIKHYAKFYNIKSKLSQIRGTDNIAKFAYHIDCFILIGKTYDDNAMFNLFHAQSKGKPYIMYRAWDNANSNKMILPSQYLNSMYGVIMPYKPSEYSSARAMVGYADIQYHEHRILQPKIAKDYQCNIIADIMATIDHIYF